jgi:hypothetical protein
MAQSQLKEYFTSQDVEDVYSTARLAHLGQKRRSGEGYFSHPKGVANIIRRLYPGDLKSYMVALLHDTIEDVETVGNMSRAELEEMIAGSIADPAESQEILTAVQLLVHTKDIAYDEYIGSLTSNLLALRVKLADMIHNLTHSPSPTQIIKYTNAYRALKDSYKGNIPGVSRKHMEQLDTLTEGLTKGEHLLREYVRDLLCESYEDIVDLMMRLRINFKNDRDSFTLQDVLTDVRGIKNVITVRQIGSLQHAPEGKKWVKLDIGFEDDESFDVPDLEKELRQVRGVDMVNVVMYNDVPWNEER